MPESQPSVSDVMRQLSILTSKFESSASQLQSLQEGMLLLQSQMGRLDRMEGDLSRLSTQNKEALQMVARASDSPSAYDISIHDLPQEHVLQPEHWKPEHYCSDNLRRQLLQRVEHEVRKLFGNSADPTAVPGDSIGLKDALDTIQSHLEACDELVKRGQAVSMKSITPAIENVIFLRYKHKWGRRVALQWKDALKSSPIGSRYDNAHDTAMEFYKNCSIVQGAVSLSQAKNGGGRGFAASGRGRTRGRGGRGGRSYGGGGGVARIQSLKHMVLRWRVQTRSSQYSWRPHSKRLG